MNILITNSLLHKQAWSKKQFIKTNSCLITNSLLHKQTEESRNKVIDRVRNKQVLTPQLTI